MHKIISDLCSEEIGKKKEMNGSIIRGQVVINIMKKIKVRKRRGPLAG